MADTARLFGARVELHATESEREVTCRHERSRKLMRVDRWLWTARFFKTRSLAAGAVTGGRVHVNGVAVKPSREVAQGDRLEITSGYVRRTVIVHSAAERRVSAAAAAELFEETEDSIAERKRSAELRRLSGPVIPGGRPTKRDRRRYDAGTTRRRSG